MLPQYCAQESLLQEFLQLCFLQVPALLLPQLDVLQEQVLQQQSLFPAGFLLLLETLQYFLSQQPVHCLPVLPQCCGQGYPLQEFLQQRTGSLQAQRLFLSLQVLLQEQIQVPQQRYVLLFLQQFLPGTVFSKMPDILVSHIWKAVQQVLQ